MARSVRLLGVTIALMLAAYSCAAQAQTPPPFQRIAWPGVAALPPHALVEFLNPPGCPGPCPTPRGISVTNDGDTAVAGSYDGATLVLTASPSYAVSIRSGCDAESGSAMAVKCTIAAAPSFPAVVFAVSTQSSEPVAHQQATYRDGWNLLGAPDGTTIAPADGPLYTVRAGSPDYEVVPSPATLVGGTGYWAYFDTAAMVDLPVVGPVSTSVELPAGQWILIGDPGQAPVAASGANAVVFAYDTASARYEPTVLLSPGQGAWAYSAVGGSLTLSSGLP